MNTRSFESVTQLAVTLMIILTLIVGCGESAPTPTISTLPALPLQLEMSLLWRLT